MEKTSIRLGSTLTFDSKKEMDMVMLAEKLNETHRMGEFMSALFRLAVDNPELISGQGKDVRYGRTMANLAKRGITVQREEFFNLVNKSLESISERVDKIYSMSKTMYALAQFGKTIGLQEKSVNVMRANFIIEKNLEELCKLLDIDKGEFKKADVSLLEKESKDMLEYTINCYDGVIEELKEERKQCETEAGSKDNVRELEETLKKVKEERDELFNKYSELKEKTDKHSEEYNRENEEIGKLKRENEALSKQNIELQERYTKVKEEKNSLESELEEEIRKLKKDKINLECDVDELKLKLKRASIDSEDTLIAKEETKVKEEDKASKHENTLDNDEVIDFGTDESSMSALEKMLGI